MPHTYCVRCKRKTQTFDTAIEMTKNNRYMLTGKCDTCNTKKCQFISHPNKYNYK